MERVYKREGILFKILPCLLIAMYAIMCLFGSSVCASSDGYVKSFTINTNDSNYNISANFPIDSNYYVVVKRLTYDDSGSGSVIKNDVYALGISSSPFCYQEKGEFRTNCLRNTEDTKIYYTFFDLSDDTNLSFSSDIFKNDRWALGNYETFEVVYTSRDIYSLQQPDKLVFQGASQEALATIIRPQVKGIQLQEVLQEIIQILPLIIVVVVSFLGLRKALSLLLTLLRRS